MQNAKILVVDDDQTHQRLLSIIIQRGFKDATISTANDGEECRRKITEEPFDCIVTDFNLPGCHTYELLTELKDVAPNVPVIVVSSSDEQQIVIDSMRSGVIDFIPKHDAFTSDVLCQRISKALAEQRRREGERRKTDRRKRELIEQAIRDHLTGLYNRRYMDEMLKRLSREPIDPRANVSITMVDVDHFKQVNDSHGHPFGDTVLQAVAEKILASCRDSDVAARWGGEEFLILKIGTDPVHAMNWAELLRQTIRDVTFEVNGAQVGVTISAGVVNLPIGEVTEDAVAKADKAMYLAKQHGRNRMFPGQIVSFYEKVLQVSATSNNPVEKLNNILYLTQSTLGPTQWEDLTRHSQEVSRAAVRLGRNSDVNPATLERLRVAGLCHDLGKFVIPEAILAKSTPLSSEERKLLSLHAPLGAEMALMLGVDHETADYIRHHHQHYNATESNDGVDGSSVPLGARLLHIADALITMTSERPYQKKRTAEGAFSELRRERGRQFDPILIDKTFDAVEQGKLVGTI